MSSDPLDRDEIIKDAAEHLYTADDVCAVNMLQRYRIVCETIPGWRLSAHNARIVQRGQELLDAGARLVVADDETDEYDSPRLHTFDSGILALRRCA